MKNQHITKVLLRARKQGGCELIMVNQDGVNILVPFASHKMEGNFMKQAAEDHSCSGRFLEFLTEKGVELSEKTTKRIAVLEDGAILLNEEPTLPALEGEKESSIWNGPDKGWITLLAFFGVLTVITIICFFAAQAKIAQLNLLEITH